MANCTDHVPAFLLGKIGSLALEQFQVGILSHVYMKPAILCRCFEKGHMSRMQQVKATAHHHRLDTHELTGLHKKKTVRRGGQSDGIDYLPDLPFSISDLIQS